MTTSVRTVNCFGDSFPYGYGDRESYHGWAGKLAQRFHAVNEVEGTEIVGLPAFYRLGVLGETALRLQERVRHERASRHGRKVLNIVSVGMNDSALKISGDELCSADSFRDSITDIYHTLTEIAGDSVLFISNTNFDEERTQNFRNRGVSFTRERVATYLEIAGETITKLGGNTVMLFEMSNTADFLSNMLDKDGLHPNARGHQWVYEQVLPHAERLWD